MQINRFNAYHNDIKTYLKLYYMIFKAALKDNRELKKYFNINSRICQTFSVNS